MIKNRQRLFLIEKLLINGVIVLSNLFLASSFLKACGRMLFLTKLCFMSFVERLFVTKEFLEYAYKLLLW